MTVYQEFITPMLDWLHANPHWSGLFTFLISFAESLAIIGTIVPGSITMAAIGVLVGSGVIPALSTFIYAVLGAIVGDNASYYLGYYFRDHIVDYWPFSRYPKLLEQGQDYFSRHGGKSVFFGRFFGPLRAIIPVIAGMMQMPNGRFFLANVTSGFLWSLLYLMPGVLLGAAAQLITPEKATLYLFYALAASLSIWLAFKLIKTVTTATSKKTQQVLEQFWHWLHRHPKLETFVSLIAEGEKPLSIKQLCLLMMSLLLFFSFIMLSQNVYHHGISISLNEAASHLAMNSRLHWLNIFFILVTLSADKYVIIPLMLMLVVNLYYKQLKRQAWITLSLLTSTVATITITKHLVFFERPTLITLAKTTPSFPSGHTALAVLASFTISYLYSQRLPRYLRQYTYMSAFFYSVVVAFSRLYLGDHWLTDVTASFLLSGALISFHLLLMRRKKFDAKQLPKLTYVLGFWLLISSLVASTALSSILERTAINPHATSLTSEQWLAQGDNRQVRLWRLNRLGHKRQFLNIQTQLPLKSLKGSLVAYGWQSKQPYGFSDYLSYYLKPTANSYQPLLNPLYLGRKPDLTLIKKSDDKNLILRLWKTKTVLSDKDKFISVGALYTINLKKRHGAFKHLYHVSYQDISIQKLADKRIKSKTLKENGRSLYLLVDISD